MSKKKKILLRLLEGGASQAAIAMTLHVSKRDVSETAKAIEENGLTFDGVMSMDAAEVDEAFFPRKPRPRDDSYLQPDIGALIERKTRNRKLPVKKFWFEHCEQAAGEGKAAYSYQAFCEMFTAEVERTGASRHFQHAPGEKAYVDWSGLPAKLTDKVTGHTTKVYVLVIALPCSDRFWAGGYTDMRQRSWLDGHMEAFEEFGGTPRMLVPDNCATATDRSSVYTTLVNRDYERFAEHYGCAVVPARVRRPRDKNLAESTVDLVEKWVIAPSDELTFYTLEEFNGYCRERVAWLNGRPFADKDGSRMSVFEELEAPELQPLPPERYELCEWRVCKVPPDYHVRVEYMHYSVPHRLIGTSVADHPRLHGRKGQYSTDVGHMPANHLGLENPWSPDRFTSWAAKIGPQTLIAVEHVLAARPVVEQAFVPCRNILGLAKQYGPSHLERACAYVNGLSSSPSYTALKNTILALRAEDASAAPRSGTGGPGGVEDRAKSAGLVRGADAYRRGKDAGDTVDGGEPRC